MPGYDNESMVKHLSLLMSVCTKKKKVTVKRGRKVEEAEVMTFKVEDGIVDRLQRSIDYYKKLGRMDSSEGFKLRQYQVEIIDKAVEILAAGDMVYLAMEVRTGKTLTSLSIAGAIGSSNVLFLTKKKAIDSINGDFERLGVGYNLTVTNYESMHKLPDTVWDTIILDEAHTLGAFPKPSNRAIAVRNMIGDTGAKVILLSGTPTPESYSQIYHQVFGVPGNPFSGCKNFYDFANMFVDVKKKIINGYSINDYHKCSDEAIDLMHPFTIRYSQSDAGFITETKEKILTVRMSQKTTDIIKRLKEDLVVEGNKEVILADTPVKLMSKVHQLCSGTIKFESGNSMVIDLSKAEYIKQYFKGYKIGIFYKFKEELSALQQVFGYELTTELSQFNATGKNIALQIVSGREGISLRKAQCLVYYNIDFSATSYWQSRDRMTTIDRPFNEVYWVFSEGGIEKDIYKAVTKKKDYTLSHFKKTLTN